MLIQLTGMLMLQAEHLNSSTRTFAREVLSIPAFAKYFIIVFCNNNIYSKALTKGKSKVPSRFKGSLQREIRWFYRMLLDHVLLLWRWPLESITLVFINNLLSKIK